MLDPETAFGRFVRSVVASDAASEIDLVVASDVASEMDLDVASDAVSERYLRQLARVIGPDHATAFLFCLCFAARAFSNARGSFIRTCSAFVFRLERFASACTGSFSSSSLSPS